MLSNELDTMSIAASPELEPITAKDYLEKARQLLIEAAVTQRDRELLLLEIEVKLLEIKKNVGFDGRLKNDVQRAGARAAAELELKLHEKKEQAIELACKQRLCEVEAQYYQNLGDTINR